MIKIRAFFFDTFVFINISHFYFLQNHCATFNKTYGKANLGEGNSGLFKQRVLISPFEALLKLYCFSLETVFLRLAILANGPFVPIMISVC